MCVYIYVYMYVYTYVYTCTCIYIRIDRNCEPKLPQLLKRVVCQKSLKIQVFHKRAQQYGSLFEKKCSTSSFSFRKRAQ